MDREPLPSVARLLGHKNIRSTLRYTHQDDSMAIEAADIVANSIAHMMDQGASSSDGPDIPATFHV